MFFFEIAKSADHAVGGALLLDFLHAVALAALVGQIVALGDNAVEPDAHVEPFAGEGDVFC